MMMHLDDAVAFERFERLCGWLTAHDKDGSMLVGVLALLLEADNYPKQACAHLAGQLFAFTESGSAMEACLKACFMGDQTHLESN